MIPRFTFAAQTQPGAGFHAGGDFQLDRFTLLFFTRAVARMTGFSDKFAMTVTMGTCGADGEKTARLSDLASSVTGWAGGRRGAGRRSRSLTFMAGIEFFQIDRGGQPESRVEKRYFQVVTQISAGSCGLSCPSATPCVAKAEYIFKNIAEIGENIVETAETLETGVA